MGFGDQPPDAPGPHPVQQEPSHGERGQQQWQRELQGQLEMFHAQPGPRAARETPREDEAQDGLR